MPRTALACLVALVVGVAAPSPAHAQAGPASCTTAGKNLYVRDVMSNRYLRYADMPDVDPTSFANFVEPSYAALDAAFAELAAAGLDDLVLDLRYNGGGLVNVAQHLASYVGGARTDGQVFAEFFHNDKNAFRNRLLQFEAKPNQLTLERLIVVTTRASASASELVINALRPFMPVVIIGDTTYGKPVGQYAIGFCDKLLAPVSFSLRNADGHGDFFDGFAPDCAAPDDAAHQLGDPEEGSLKEALAVAETGACTPRPLTPQRKADGQRHPRRVLGWQSVVNAY
jgi:hypothetical protein